MRDVTTDYVTLKELCYTAAKIAFLYQGCELICVIQQPHTRGRPGPSILQR